MKVTADQIHAARKWLVSSDLKTRLKTPGLDESRADIIVAGAVVIDTILQELGVKELILCQWALREGILLDYIHGHKRSLARAEAYPDVRRRSVVSLAERSQWHEKHARKVAELALALFDGTAKPARPRGRGARAARIRGPSPRHRAPHRLPEPSQAHVLPDQERRAARVRPPRGRDGGHHRALPPARPPARRSTGSSARSRARTAGRCEVLAGHLRLADSLDRSHRQIVRSLEVSGRGDTLRVKCDVTADPALEIWAAPRRAELLERALRVKIKVGAGEVAEDAAAALATADDSAATVAAEALGASVAAETRRTPVRATEP